MPASSYRLEDLVPHRSTMLLIDSIVECDEENGTIETEAVIRPGWTSSVTAIELMAQTSAALAGAADIRRGYDGSPRPGFLLGTRKMDLFVPGFKPGEKCTVKAKNIFNDSTTASFECSVELADGTLAAKATLNAYRPDDMSAFLETQS